MNTSAMYPPPAGPAVNYAGPVPGAAMYPPAVAAHAPNMYTNMPTNMPNYGNVAGGYLPPPMPTAPIVPPEASSVPTDWSIPSLSEDAARAAFKDFASSHCCYSSSPAEQGVITSMEPHNTYRYRLETFTESRSTDWAYKPHEGEAPDANTQPSPQPWEVKASTPTLFTDRTEKLRIPFTSSVKDCHTCHATGKEPCDTCKGNGSKPCSSCSSSGRIGEGQCTSCNGTGNKKCSDCDSHGMKNCKTCKGKRKLLAYIEVKVEWTNHVEDYVTEQTTGLTPENLKAAHGKELFKNSQFLLYPLMGFPHPAIAEASQRMIQDHQGKYGQTSRILQQRQTVELIPITKVTYAWKAKSHSYLVYGNDNRVSDDNYPDTCCCVIL